ncbi:arsenate reductase (glutaredoxin) [Gilvimarinus xylanilyticus]|uniref:Arsenate reductase n=1 Tax=Gilvimarinus xylanilyticus TaxID=2944139 RepID=A0A9X2KRV0_9GAMM|nr:arsenate reductase (glutaredoxin) [Gilvimarinus xylanilyticus]MCP8898211.1 arsenate reductase (glutaredoxin) [Gilvimarinus xylanilyticus]
MQIYHNPRCSKSRQTLALLQERGIEPEIIRYLDTPPTAAELKSILAKLGLSPQQLMRRGEAEYKALDLANHPQSDAQLINAMIEHPKLIERPIVVAGDKACLGRPPENVLELL